MQIKELQPKQGKVDITATVIEKASPKEFQKFGAPGKLCNIKVQDDTGTIMMTLWNEQVTQVNIGDKIKVTNGYVNEWQGEMQLSTGKFGKLEVVGKSTATETQTTAKKTPEIKGVKDEEEIEEEDATENTDEEEDLDTHDNIQEEEIN